MRVLQDYFWSKKNKSHVGGIQYYYYSLFYIISIHYFFYGYFLQGYKENSEDLFLVDPDRN